MANQSQLPLKKRFGTSIENSCFPIYQEQERIKNPWIQKQQNMENNLQKPEARRVSISPGVIRHTSCPDRSLAYYYNYSSN